MPKGVYIHKSPSQETIEKIRLALKGKKIKHPIGGWNKGIKGCYKLSEETKRKISEHHKNNGVGKWMKDKRGKNANNWKGGASRRKQGSLRNRIWRTKIFERDNWTCQTCGLRGVRLEAHHIKSWSKYPKLRFNLNNGVTLCKSCHKLTDNYAYKANKI